MIRQSSGPALSRSDDAATDLELVAEVIDESGEITPDHSQHREPGEGSSQTSGTAIRGQLPKLPRDSIDLRVGPKQETESLQAEEKAFQTIDESRELAQPMADPVYLRQLAELTADHGGAAFAPDEIDTLIETIKQRRRQAETPIVEKFRLGDGPISGWLSVRAVRRHALDRVVSAKAMGSGLRTCFKMMRNWVAGGQASASPQG